MTEPSSSARAEGGCTCGELWRGRFHEDRDCPQRLQGFITGNAVDGYEVGVTNEGSIMEGRVVRRYPGPIKSERRARKVAAKMLADERRREQTEIRESIL